MQQAIFATLGTILKSKLFWIIISVIIVYIIVKRNWNHIANLGKPRFIEYETNAQGEVLNFSDDKKNRLKDLAERLYTQIYTPFAGDSEVYNAVKYLNDQELLFLANYYKQAYKANIYTDIDDEFLPGTDSDDIILGRLKKMGFLK